MTAYAAGTFCWPELGTTDAQAATTFYTKLFDWTVNSMPMPGGSYNMLKLDDKDVGALYSLHGEQLKAGFPPNWLSYIAVDDVDATTSKVKANGGKVLVEPMDVKPDGKTLIGRMAAFQDPEGASFAVWKAGIHQGAGVVDEPGSRAWTELLTRDLTAARKFYTAVFGWSCEAVDMPSGPYTLIKNQGSLNGGMMKMPKEAGEAPASWTIYFAVDDCDASAKKAASLGGKVVVPPTDIPTVGRMAWIQDPQGAVFVVIKMDPPAS
jgi:predicted enzyme related to lactoylglutathione lyase